MKKILLKSALLASLGVAAQQNPTDSIGNKELGEVNINAKRNVYKMDSSLTVSKMPLKDIENAQVYNSINKLVLKEQLVTNLNGALKNATGVTRLWESTGRGGDGGEYYSMRGFSLQPSMMNGMPNISNGTIDPVNIENIEVIKGPSGTLYGGSLISYGGLVNIVTKKAYEGFGGEFGYVMGNYGLSRFTTDVNTPLGKNVFIRVNAAYHNERTFQDAGFNNSFYIAPSIKVIASNRLTFYVNTEFKNGESANAPMIFLSRYSKLSFNSMDLFEKNYEKSYTTNNLSIKNPGFSMQSQAIYKISKSWTSQTILSRSNTSTNGYYQYLWDAANGDEFTRFISKRNGQTNTTNIQQNLNGDFKIGRMRHRVLVGLDYLTSEVSSYSTGWVANGKISLVNQTDSGSLNTQAVDQLLINSTEAGSIAKTEIMSIYVSDVINITPKLSLMASARVDAFTGNPSIYSTDKLTTQTTVSPKFGLVYQPILNKFSVFANYMNGFKNLAPVQVAEANGSNPRMKILNPEQANQWEVGTKTNIYKEKISLTLSYYNILVSNKSMTDPNNVNNTIQGGEVESKGYEISLVTNPIEGLSIIAGYSHNDNKVTKDVPNGGYLGYRTEEAGPADIANFWANYKIPFKKLRGLSLGVGGNYAGKYLTLNRENIGQFALPSYTIYNAVIAYNVNNYGISFKVDNLTNTKYYTGWSTVTPQRLRNVSFGVSYKF